MNHTHDEKTNLRKKKLEIVPDTVGRKALLDVQLVPAIYDPSSILDKGPGREQSPQQQQQPQQQEQLDYQQQHQAQHQSYDQYQPFSLEGFVDEPRSRHSSRVRNKDFFANVFHVPVALILIK